MSKKTNQDNTLYGSQGRSDHHTMLVNRSMQLIPGGTTTSAIPLKDHEFLVEKGEGAYIYDVDGRKYLDFFMGSGPLVLGHAHPRIKQAILRAVDKGTHHLGLHRRTLELAERLISYIPNAEQVRFTSSGTEATMHALRLARVVTGRRMIIKFDGAYHGHHDLAVWSIGRSSMPLPEPSPESSGTEESVEGHIRVLPFNDTDTIRRFMSENGDEVAAIICEPLQRAIPPVPGFLKALREQATRYGCLLIFDEVVTGFRLARGGAQERYGVIPDIATIGKAISGGIPMAAIVGKHEYMSHFEPAQPLECYSFHCGTFSGYYLGAECAHEVLDILIEEGGIEKLNDLGELARETLIRTFHDLNIDAQVIGDGSVFETFFTDKPVQNQADVRNSDTEFAGAFHRCLYEAGIYKTSVKTYLSIVHGEDEINQLADAASWAVKKLKS